MYSIVWFLQILHIHNYDFIFLVFLFFNVHVNTSLFIMLKCMLCSATAQQQHWYLIEELITIKIYISDNILVMFFFKGWSCENFLNTRYHCAFLVEKYFISLNYTNGNWHRWRHTYEIVSYAYICDNNIRGMLIKQVAKKISRQIKWEQ